MVELDMELAVVMDMELEVDQHQMQQLQLKHSIKEEVMEDLVMDQFHMLVDLVVLLHIAEHRLKLSIKEVMVVLDMVCLMEADMVISEPLQRMPEHQVSHSIREEVMEDSDMACHMEVDSVPQTQML